MKKRTIAIVSISLVLAILAVAVIATFPTYLFEDETGIPATNPGVQSDTITEATQGDDVGIVGGTTGGAEAVLPDGSTGTDNSVPTSTPNSALNALASDGGAKLLAENGAFRKDTEFKVNKLGIFSKKYYRARHYVRDFAKNYLIYEVTAKKDGNEVQPLGIAKVVIEIPEKYNIDDVEVYYMLSDGGVQKLDCAIDKEARTATVSFMQSGVYILIERDKTSTDDTSSDTATESEESSASSDSSSDVSSGSDDSSDSTDSSTSSDNASSTESDPNKDSMDGWTPWY